MSLFKVKYYHIFGGNGHADLNVINELIILIH